MRRSDSPNYGPSSRIEPPMFPPEERSQLRSDLLQYAVNDTRIAGGAITGSAAVDGEDRWSDIDLAFGVADAAQLSSVLSDWTTFMYENIAPSIMSISSLVRGSTGYFSWPALCRSISHSRPPPNSEPWRQRSGWCSEERIHRARFRRRSLVTSSALAGCTLCTREAASGGGNCGKPNT